MMARSRLIPFLQRFRADESGSITVEALIMIPMLVWCYVGTFVFFDAFRMQSKNIKASYTIGDTLSRETGFVTPNYLNGLFNLHGLLLNTDEPRALQITAFRYNQANDRYTVVWSRALGGYPQLTTSTLAALRNRLPVMPNGEVAILTRSRVGYEPIYEVGLNEFDFEEFTVTRPRFTPQLCFNSVENGTLATAIC